MKQHDHLSSKEEIDNIKLWEINYASLVHTLLKGISEEEPSGIQYTFYNPIYRHGGKKCISARPDHKAN